MEEDRYGASRREKRLPLPCGRAGLRLTRGGGSMWHLLCHDSIYCTSPSSVVCSESESSSRSSTCGVPANAHAHAHMHMQCPFDGFAPPPPPNPSLCFVLCGEENLKARHAHDLAVLLTYRRIRKVTLLLSPPSARRTAEQYRK